MTECYKQSLTGHASRSLENISAENDMDYGDPTQEVSEETILAAGLEAILKSILTKHVAVFYLCYSFD